MQIKKISTFVKYIIFPHSWFEPFVMQWLNENDDSSMEILKNAFMRDAEDGVSGPSFSINCFNSMKYIFFSVSTKLGTFSILQFRRWFVHSADAMLWCYQQVGMSRSRSCETIYEAICENDRQSVNRIYGHCQERIPQLCERREKGKMIGMLLHDLQ